MKTTPLLSWEYYAWNTSKHSKTPINRFLSPCFNKRAATTLGILLPRENKTQLHEKMLVSYNKKFKLKIHDCTNWLLLATEILARWHFLKNNALSIL